MIRMTLDNQNAHFTLRILDTFSELKQWTTPYLEWLMMEHYQFSFHNTSFLMTAHLQTKSLKEQGVSDALLDNYNEEKNHARMYQHALKKIGLDVSNRTPSEVTMNFFNTILSMIQIDASRTLGVLYATETAAIFEHILFKKLSDELCQRNGFIFEGSRLKHFHDLHLDGVEQAHKDELGQFIDTPATNEECDPNIYLDAFQIEKGALEAIELMKTWWTGLIKEQERFKEFDYA